MLKGFEQQTSPLNEYELGTLLPIMVKCLGTKTGAANVISSSTIIRKMKAAGYKLDGPRLRKIIAHIRANDLIVGLVSTGKGYFVATKASEIDDCISSMQGRVDAIQSNIDALKRQRDNIYNN
jgi:hypothetical protein